jgi:hypothetical protein
MSLSAADLHALARSAGQHFAESHASAIVLASADDGLTTTGLARSFEQGVRDFGTDEAAFARWWSGTEMKNARRHEPAQQSAQRMLAWRSWMAAREGHEGKQ